MSSPFYGLHEQDKEELIHYKSLAGKSHRGGIPKCSKLRQTQLRYTNRLERIEAVDFDVNVCDVYYLVHEEM